MRYLITILTLILPLSSIPAGDTSVGMEMNTPSSTTAEYECGKLAKITAQVPDTASVIFFVLTQDVDYEIQGKTLWLATPCRNETIQILLQGIDWENKNLLAQKTLFVKVACKNPTPPVPRPDVDPDDDPDGPDVPTSLDIPEPSERVKSVVQPITDKLKSDPTKATKVAWCFAGFAKALEGENGSKVTNTTIFGQLNQAALQTLGMSEGTQIGEEVTIALVKYTGIDLKANRNLSSSDRSKIAEVLYGVSWAAVEAGN